MIVVGSNKQAGISTFTLLPDKLDGPVKSVFTVMQQGMSTLTSAHPIHMMKMFTRGGLTHLIASSNDHQLHMFLILKSGIMPLDLNRSLQEDNLSSLAF